VAQAGFQGPGVLGRVRGTGEGGGLCAGAAAVGLGPGKGGHVGAGAAAAHGGGGGLVHGFQFLVHGVFVEFVGRAFDDLERAHGAVAQACAQAVAELVGLESGLAVHDADGPFGAVGQAFAAAVAQFLVYFHDLSGRFHGGPPLA